MRRGRWLVLAAALLGGCLPLRVDIAQRVSGGYVATARQCDEKAQARAESEAVYFCEARGLRAGTRTQNLLTKGGNCSLQVTFWCHFPDDVR